MTANTSVFDPIYAPSKLFLLLEISRSLRRLFQPKLAANGRYCQASSEETCHEQRSILRPTFGEGEIVYNMIAGGSYPYKKRF